MVVLGVAGYRYYSDYEFIEEKLLDWERCNGNIDEIVSGGAAGVDTCAEIFAKKYNKKITVLKPDWNKHGRKAGILRNTDIVEKSTHLIAFPSEKSKGTFDTIRKARNKNISVTVHLVD